MISEEAVRVAHRLRQHVGNDRIGIGPDINELVTIFSDIEGSKLRKVLDELEQHQFIRLDQGMAAAPGAYPTALRGVVGIAVMEPLQAYFDNIDE